MKLKKGYIGEGKVKLGLVICAEKQDCSRCPYFKDSFCVSRLTADALNYISRLERIVDYGEEKKLF